MVKFNRYFSVILVGTILMLALHSCNKEFPNLLEEYGEAQDPAPVKDKVLLLVVESLSGPAVQRLEPTNLTLMARNALVTYGGLTDASTNYEVTSESVWASLLTGVTGAKNGVTGTDIGMLNKAMYPTIISRLANLTDARSSTFYTSSQQYAAVLGEDADHIVTEAGDEQLVSKAAVGLTSDSADLQVLQLSALAQLSQNATSEAYAEALGKIDLQIKTLVDAVKARTTYRNENWLIVVTSSKGGVYEKDEVDYTAFGDPERETYCMFYSPRFSTKVTPRPSANDIPFAGNAVRYTYGGGNQVVGKLSDVSKINMGATEDWTINLFLRYNTAGANYYYPSFFSKRAQGFSGPGWNMFLEGNYWGFNSSIAGQVFGKVINDGQWHALTVVIRRSGTMDSVFTYTDGLAESSRAVSASVNANSLNNDAPLTLGYIAGDGNTSCDLSIANVQIYNRAFTPAEVRQYTGIVEVGESHPFWSDLRGYWPCYPDVNTTTLTDKTANAGNFRLQGPASWISFNELVAFFQPPISPSFYRMVPNAVDIPFIIYQWLGVSVEQSWGMDGRSWSPNYSQVRN
ncbi:LamG-like jellyroll fold domain-containing protein [Sphingobacterium griseoflavum]|uniref:DUF4983 domain-containing protein n=1 Tax=Sphingobacterium griseoflavum TaxID=1474952 RepID=A0ABQ3HWS6_9SPHI|nr:LamG-like jellyroll fold domain-containing protein [Sphingobacterium griseoflavum]GHE39456.1 hypothetical protein GCM10017764_23370 [Sphingobacterium griseoflavum]